MEFINTIWSALTTQNEGLSNMVCMPFIYIEITVAMLLFTAFFNLKPTKKQQIIYVIVLGSLGILTGIIFTNTYKFIVNLFLNFILIKIIFKTSFIQTLIAQLLPILCIALFEYIITNVIFDIGAAIIAIPIYRLLLALSVYLLLFLLSILLKKFKGNFIAFNIKSKNHILLFTTILGLLSIISQVFITYFYSSKLPIGFCILNWILT